MQICILESEGFWMANELLTPKQVRDTYGFSVQQLAHWRWMGTGPSYIKTGESKAGRIKYRRSAIEQWLDERTVHGGSAA
ncbi:helix-turn-helix domain-containing protein [Streptomyces scabiei]|uniref:helix-turn-helix transcriptional regulator n=1 Tax=Streptomyces scabiei TaxID=1930 RepID=UPI0029BB2688|nr:helix-turn-helix domain-containing protein [Streptomyces scabiei]MDX3519271.1 DNA-binding protein [Streptomyces scabiei]